MTGAMTDLPTGRLTAVCATHAVMPQLHPPSGEYGDSGIDKRPLTGRVVIGPLGVEGDIIVDVRHHGGHDQAVYAYADEDADHWVAELGREIPPGMFGENLRITGIPVSSAVVGERWRIGGEGGTDGEGGGVLLEVTSPRTPCAKFAAKMGEPKWIKRFHAAGLTGAYLRVVEPGSVSVGEPVTVVHRPSHGVTIRGWYLDESAADARRLLDAAEAGELTLQDVMRKAATRSLARG